MESARRATIGPMPPRADADRPTLDAALERLRGASSLVLGPIGVAAHRTPEYDAYALLAEHAAALRAELEALGREGTAAGRLYAVVLLHGVDLTAARRIADGLASCAEPVLLFWGGCTVPQESTPADEAARLVWRRQEYAAAPHGRMPDGRPRPEPFGLAHLAVLWGYVLVPIIVLIVLVRGCMRR